MNTSSYSHIHVASGTYNHWKVKTSIQRRLWRDFIQSGLVVPICIHSRSLLFEGNASLKCVYSGLMPLSTVFQSYHDGVWLVQGAQCGLVVPIFVHIIRDFPGQLFAFLLCEWLWISAIHKKGDSFHVFNLYYIVIDLEAGQYFVGRFQNLDYMHY